MPETGITFSSRNLGQQETKKLEGPLSKIKMNGFEPFINPEPSSEDSLFVNGYNGNFAQAMALDRKAVERVLKIAHLDGQVFLTSLAPNRQRSLDANPDGSVTGKRFLIFEEKIEEDEKENPYCKVASIPQGWKIEINDTRIRDELMKKANGNVRDIQKPFIQRFNGHLNQALWECIWREKFTSVKDKWLKEKVLFSLLPIVLQGGFSAAPLINAPIDAAPRIIAGIFLTYLLLNILGDIGKSVNKRLYTTLEAIDPNCRPTKSSRYRQTDGLWEYVMPRVEIDKVVRSAIFLGTKGRTMVKEIRSEKK